MTEDGFLRRARFISIFILACVLLADLSVPADSQPKKDVALSFTTPAPGTVVGSTQTVVVGRAPTGESVVIGSVSAERADTTFLANGVLLEPGPNTLIATSGGQSASVFLTSQPVFLPCGGSVVFGPRGYLRRTGSPFWDEKTFAAPDPSGEYRVEVHVGDDEDTSKVNATIELNGETLWRPSDFVGKPGAFLLAKQVRLLAENEIRVRLTSAPGTFLIVSIERVTGDGTGPVLSLESPAEESFVSVTEVTVTGRASDENLSWVRVEGVPAKLLEGNRFQAEGVPLEEGPNEMSVVAEDLCGNGSSLAFQLIRDTIPPEISLEAPSHGAHIREPAVVTFSATDLNLDTVTASLDGAPIETGVTVSEEGAHTVLVSATDKAGNGSTVIRSFTLDRTGPTLRFWPEPDSYHNISVIPVVTAEDFYLAFVEILVDGDLYDGEPVTEEGSHEVSATARDLAGNETTGSMRFTIDRTPPSIVVGGVRDGDVRGENITPVVEVTDTYLSGQTLMLDGSVFVSGTELTEEKDYVLYVEGWDRAGNRSSLSLSFGIDKTAPLIEISGIPGLYSCGEVTPQVTVTDSHPRTTTITLNEGEFVPGTVLSAEGTYEIRVESVDEAENASSGEAIFTIDCTEPVVVVESPEEGALTNQSFVGVSGRVEDVSPIEEVKVGEVVASLSEARFTASSVELPLEGINTIVVTATDAAGKAGSSDVHVRLDTVPPVISLSGPSTGRRNESLSVTAEASDDVELASVQFSVDGVDGPEIHQAPFEHGFVVPGTAAGGSTIDVVAVATDRAGNKTVSAPHSIRVISGGFLMGEVYNDSKGLLIAGVRVSTATGSTVSNAMGRFGLFTEETTARVLFEKEGFTRVERVVTVDSELGTLLLDARLTPLNPSSVSMGPGGGTASGGHFELVVQPEALSSPMDVRLTEVSPQGLRAELPLGWSPVGGVEIEPEDLSLAIPAELRLRESVSGMSLVLVHYRSDLGRWVVEAEGLTGDDTVSAGIGSGGSWAFVVADTGATAPPVAVAGEALSGSEPVDVSFGLSAFSEVNPEASPVGPEARATGHVVLGSLIPLPSGTVISALVEESFESFEEGELRPEPFSQEILLYRYPLRPDEGLHAFFPVTPSRVLMAEAIRKGKVHVEIHPSPAFLRGDLVTGVETVVTGEGAVELLVPAGAVTGALAAFVEALDPATLDPAPTGMSLVGAAEVDLAGQSLEVEATLSVLAPEGLSPENLFAARVLTVSGQRKLNFLGPASLVGVRLSTAGIFSGGTYLFFQSSEPLAFVQGTVTEGGLPARLVVVESSTAPFSYVTGDSGVYLVAAALRETQVTARSVSSGNTGSASITPSTPDPLTLDIVLSATGPFVTGVVPKDGSQGVPLASVVTLEFSERVEPSTLTQDSFSLRVAGGEVLEGRITLGTNKRSASFLPAKNLEPVTVYQISATEAITDASGNGLLPFTSSFTTKDITVAGFNPDAVTISFPNEEGEVTVWAPEGSFESGASILIINNTNGVVTSGMVLSDGSFSIELRAAITDEIQIRIRDSSDREVVIEKTEFHAGDGRVAIGKKGGTIREGDFTLEVPEAALSEAAIFKLLPMAQELIDQLPLPEGAGGKGAAVEIDTGGVTLEREAKLFFPTVPDAPEEADFLVVRKIVENDLTLYETIDSASLEDGKIHTDSFPFPGILEPGFYLSLWYPTVPSTGKSPLGVITGIAQETDANPAGPTTVPLKGVTVRVDDPSSNGEFTATTGVDGRFTLWDLNFGGTIELVALDSKGRESHAVAFEDPTLLGQFPNLARYGRVGEVVLNFPLSPPPPPPSSIELRLFREEEGEEKEITNGFVTTGEKLILRVFFTDSPGRASLDVNGLPVSLENIDGLSYQGFFTPSEARGYTVVVTAVDAFLRPLTVTKSFLAVQAGSGNDEPLPGPPSVISDSAIPRPGETGVPLAQIFSVQFTEPVTNVSTGSVILRKAGSSTGIPVELIGSGSGGVGPVTPSSEIWSLTLRPQRGLEFASPYELVFTGAIIDTDTPTASSLSPDPTIIDFTTFSPASLGETEVSEAMGIAVVKNRVFVARNTFSASVRGFDISDPVHPERIPDISQDTVLFGIMPQITSEEDVDMGFGETDLIGTLTTNIFSGQEILEVFDVRGKNSPFSWSAAVTTNSGAPGTYAADVALFKGFAYVAVGEGGIEVIDLESAADLLRTTPLLEVTQSLSTKGAGFAQSAILNTIPIEFNGETLTAGAVAVDDTSLGRVAFVGSWGYLSSVDVSAFVPQPIFKTIPLEITINGSETLSMGFVREIGLTSIEGRELAVLVGGPASGRTQGTLGIVDVTDPANPTVLAILELQGSSATSLAFDEDASTVYVGTAEAVEAYNLTDPAAPEFAGTIQGIGVGAAGIAISEGILVAAGAEIGIQTTTLGPIVPLLTVEPDVVLIDENDETIDDLVIRYQVVPSAFRVQSASIEIREDTGEVLFSTSVPPEEEGEVRWPKGQSLQATPESMLFEVRNPDGTLSNPYGAGAAPEPELIQLLPSIAPSSNEDLELTLIGRKFVPGSHGRMFLPGGESELLPGSVTDETEMRVTIPSELMGQVGVLRLSVVSGIQVSNVLELRIVPPSMPAGPILNTIDPSSVLAQSGDQWITLAGEGFAEGDSVAVIEGMEGFLTTNFVSSTEIQALVPSIALEEPGPMAIRVSSIQQPLRVSEAKSLEVLPVSEEGPFIDSVLPAVIPYITREESSREIRLNGKGFQPGAQVIVRVEGDDPISLPTTFLSPEELVFTLSDQEWSRRDLVISYTVQAQTGIWERIQSLFRTRPPRLKIRWDADVFDAVSPSILSPLSETEREAVKVRARAKLERAFSEWEIEVLTVAPDDKKRGRYNIVVTNNEPPGDCGEDLSIIGKQSWVNSSHLAIKATGFANVGGFESDRDRILDGIAQGIAATSAHEVAHQICDRPEEIVLVHGGGKNNYDDHACDDFEHFYTEKTWSTARECIDKRLKRRE